MPWLFPLMSFFVLACQGQERSKTQYNRAVCQTKEEEAASQGTCLVKSNSAKVTSANSVVSTPPRFPSDANSLQQVHVLGIDPNEKLPETPVPDFHGSLQQVGTADCISTVDNKPGTLLQLRKCLSSSLEQRFRTIPTGNLIMAIHDKSGLCIGILKEKEGKKVPLGLVDCSLVAQVVMQAEEVATGTFLAILSTKLCVTVDAKKQLVQDKCTKSVETQLFMPFSP